MAGGFYQKGNAERSVSKEERSRLRSIAYALMPEVAEYLFHFVSLWKLFAFQVVVRVGGLNCFVRVV